MIFALVSGSNHRLCSQQHHSQTALGCCQAETSQSSLLLPNDSAFTGPTTREPNRPTPTLHGPQPCKLLTQGEQLSFWASVSPRLNLSVAICGVYKQRSHGAQNFGVGRGHNSSMPSLLLSVPCLYSILFVIGITVELVS